MAPKKKLVKNKATKSKTKDETENEEVIENKPEEEEEAETETEADGPKSKKSIDIEAVLEPAPIIEEKVDDEIVTPTEDGDELSTDELSLDDDELNPFGDKWEQ